MPVWPWACSCTPLGKRPHEQKTAVAFSTETMAEAPAEREIPHRQMESEIKGIRIVMDNALA